MNLATWLRDAHLNKGIAYSQGEIFWALHVIKPFIYSEHNYCSNFYVTNTPSYGNCYTFNSAINDKDTYGGDRVSSMAGPNFGLDLVIDIEQSKYMGEGVTESAGARVVVQSSSSHPQPDEMGNQLHPNTNTALV